MALVCLCFHGPTILWPGNCLIAFVYFYLQGPMPELWPDNCLMTFIFFIYISTVQCPDYDMAIALWLLFVSIFTVHCPDYGLAIALWPLFIFIFTVQCLNYGLAWDALLCGTHIRMALQPCYSGPMLKCLCSLVMRDQRSDGLANFRLVVFVLVSTLLSIQCFWLSCKKGSLKNAS